MSTARGLITLKISCVGPGDLGLAIAVNSSKLALPANHEAVKTVRPWWGGVSSYRELRANEAGRLQFLVQQFSSSSVRTKTVFAAFGSDHTASAIQQLLHCFASNDRPTIARHLAATTAARDCYGRDIDLVFGFEVPDQMVEVNRNHLRCGLGKLLVTLTEDRASLEAIATAAA